jgi:hypothetical protein
MTVCNRFHTDGKSASALHKILQTIEDNALTTCVAAIEYRMASQQRFAAIESTTIGHGRVKRWRYQARAFLHP